MIFGTGCDRVRFSVVVGTSWLQYGPSGRSRDYFRARGGFGGRGGAAPCMCKIMAQDQNIYLFAVLKLSPEGLFILRKAKGYQDENMYK